MDPVFLFKKVVSLFLDPVAAVLGLSLWGWFSFWLARVFERREKLLVARRFRFVAVGFIVVSGVCLYLGSLGPVSESLTRSLEKSVGENIDQSGEYRFEERPEFVVVLAGGHRASAGKPSLSGLTRHAFARVVGGVELWKKYPESRFVVTGHPDETGVMRKIAVKLGVPPHRVISESESRDTKDHPVYLKPILGDKPFLLVTSATHMPRSAGLFRGQGLNPILAPVDFQSWPKGDGFSPYAPNAIAPKAVNLYRTAVAMHEIIGLRWAKLRGQIRGGDY